MYVTRINSCALAVSMGMRVYMWIPSVSVDTNLEKHRVFPHVYMHMYTHVYMHVYQIHSSPSYVLQLNTTIQTFTYGVATVSRIDKITGLFCRILSLL